MGDDLDKAVAGWRADDPWYDEKREAAAAARVLVKQLVAARKKAHLSQRDLAARIGTSQSAIGRLEADEHDPRLSTLSRYARAVGVTLIAHVQL